MVDDLDDLVPDTRFLLASLNVSQATPSQYSKYTNLTWISEHEFENGIPSKLPGNSSEISIDILLEGIGIGCGLASTRDGIYSALNPGTPYSPCLMQEITHHLQSIDHLFQTYPHNVIPRSVHTFDPIGNLFGSVTRRHLSSSNLHLPPKTSIIAQVPMSLEKPAAFGCISKIYTAARTTDIKKKHHQIS
jgi:hypothetical protein